MTEAGHFENGEWIPEINSIGDLLKFHATHGYIPNLITQRIQKAMTKAGFAPCAPFWICRWNRFDPEWSAEVCIWPAPDRAPVQYCFRGFYDDD